jgi:hypothetical protein
MLSSLCQRRVIGFPILILWWFELRFSFIALTDLPEGCDSAFKQSKFSATSPWSDFDRLSRCRMSGQCRVGEGSVRPPLARVGLFRTHVIVSAT